MSRLFKFSVWLTLAILIVAIFCHILGRISGWQETELEAWLEVSIIFSLPLLWTLWLCSAVLDAKKAVWQLAALWGLIDIAVLAILSLADIKTEAHGGSIKGGEEIVWVIAFSPIILPTLLASFFSETMSTGLLAIGKGMVFILYGGNMSHTFLSDWIGFSIIAVIPSFVFAWLSRFWQLRNQGRQA